MQISFQPLVQCLDVDNLIKLFTAVLLERRILLRSNKYFSNLLQLYWHLPFVPYILTISVKQEGKQVTWLSGESIIVWLMRLGVKTPETMITQFEVDLSQFHFMVGIYLGDIFLLFFYDYHSKMDVLNCCHFHFWIVCCLSCLNITTDHFLPWTSDTLFWL